MINYSILPWNSLLYIATDHCNYSNFFSIYIVKLPFKLVMKFLQIIFSFFFCSFWNEGSRFHSLLSFSQYFRIKSIFNISFLIFRSSFILSQVVAQWEVFLGWPFTVFIVLNLLFWLRDIGKIERKRERVVLSLGVTCWPRPVSTLSVSLRGKVFASAH